jgi:hypothetical protein
VLRVPELVRQSSEFRSGHGGAFSLHGNAGFCLWVI